MSKFDGVREVHPTTKDHLWAWVYAYTGVKLARNGVCKGHDAPMDAMACMHLQRPPEMLTLASRGSGKSFASAIDSHMNSRFYPNHQTLILGGAKSQALQVLNGFKEAIFSGAGPGGNDRAAISQLNVEKVEYRNGSEVKILACSETSVRGPHVPSLKLDEVDEIDPELREAAYGMVMEKSKGVPPTISMTSTWHNVGGPMGALLERALAMNADKPGSYPLFRFCLFDVLERCPESISGKNLEYCPACPLMRYCHEDMDESGGVPKAKRSDGHYTIQSAIQKMALSTRVFEADYLCRGPRPDGIWFSEFSKANISEAAEYDPNLPVIFALDTGLRTAGVWYQIHRQWAGNDFDIVVKVFADYFAEHLTPEQHLDGFPGGDGRAPVEGIKAKANRLCNGRFTTKRTDPAGRNRNAIGSATLGEWSKAGMDFTDWPLNSVLDGLSLIENLVKSADGTIRLLVHPRCVNMIRSFHTYRRRKVNGIYIDQPVDPQPDEHNMDALRSSLMADFPDGRKPQPKYERRHASSVF
jgi:hypothetical protein